MINDILTIMWKELKELFILSKPRRVIIRMLLLILFIGVIVPAEFGLNWFNSYITIYYWVWFSCFIVIGPAANSIIRERTSNSLETLLASRLPDKSIYMGKLSSGIMYSSFILIISILVSVITININEWNGNIDFFSPHIFFEGILLSFFSMLSIGGLSFISSLKVKNPLRAIQIINLIILILIIPDVYFYRSSSPRYEKMQFVERFNYVVNNYVIVLTFIVLFISTVLIFNFLRKKFNRIYLLK